MSGQAVVAAVRTALEIYRTYGPIVLELIGVGKDIATFIRNHRDHPGLSDAERAEAAAIWAADPTTIGMPQPPADVDPVPPYTGYPYGEAVIDMPDGADLVAGDIVWKRPDGRFVVTSVSIGIFIPPDWIRVFSIG